MMVLWSAWAQSPALGVEERIEIEVDSKRESWTVEPIGEDGVLLIGGDKRGQSWTLSRYDDDFQPVWSSEWAPKRSRALRDQFRDGNTVWMLFDGNRAAVELVGVNIEDGSVRTIEVDTPRKTLMAGQLVIDDGQAYMVALTRPGLLSMSGEGSLLSIDLDEEETQALDVAGAVGSRKVYLDRLSMDEEGAVMTVFHNKRKQRVYSVLDIGPKTVLLNQQLSPEREHNLLSAQRVMVPQGEVIIGTYANSRKGVGAQGLYISAWQDGNESFRRFHSFATFDRFFDYLREGKRKRVEKRAKRKQERGADLKLSYRLNIHDVIRQGERTIIVAEAFYPEYRTVTETRTVQNANGTTSTVTTTRQIFVGFRYTHAVVAAFDETGERLWDSSFPITNILSRAIRDRVEVHVDGEEIKMIYAYGGSLYTRIANADGMVVQDKAEEEQPDVRRAWASDSAYWYDGRFLTWGVQKVKKKGINPTVFTFSSVTDQGVAED